MRPLSLAFILFALILSGCGDTPKRTLETTVQGAYSVTLSPDGQYALVGSIKHGGSLWRLQDGERLYNWNHAQGQQSNIIASTFSTDSKYAITAETKRFVMWEIATGKPAGFWPADGGVLSLALSDNGRYAIVGQEDYTAMYLDLATGSQLSTLNHSGDISTVAISADGLTGITGGEDGIIRVWNLPEGKETFAYKMGDDISSVAISSDGSLVFAALYYGKGKIWQTKTGQEVTEIGHFRTTMTTAKFSADNSKLLTGFTARRVVLWDVQTGENEKEWRADAPLFWRPSGLVVTDVAFGTKPGEILNVFSNGMVYWW